MQNINTLGLHAHAQRDVILEAFEQAQERVKQFIGQMHTAAKAAWVCVGVFVFGAVLFTGWHNWNLEFDSTRKTVTLLRDGEYIGLHEIGSTQEPGLYLQQQGSAATPAIVEVGAL